MSLITGAHVMIFTRDEDADRAFLCDGQPRSRFPAGKIGMYEPRHVRP